MSANPCSCWWTGKAARAALMLLTQELQRGTGISPFWTGRKLVFKFLSVRMVKNALVGSDLCAVCSQIALQSTNDTRQKTFVLCLWTLTFLFWGRIFCGVGWSRYSSGALLGQSWKGGMQNESKKLLRSLNTLTCRKQLLKYLFKIWMSMRCKWLAKRPVSRDRITIGDCLACTVYSFDWLKFLALSQIL